jgi:adenine-specific DNA-methyltransferase
MELTAYHSKYYAHSLTRRRGPEGAERLASAFAGAQVDLNPHQVDAALFAFASPLSNGVLLADEVGLGKTIEAGLVIAQRWAEHRRRILIVTPSNLRKQWHQELSEKFFLPCAIMESKAYAEAVKLVGPRPLEAEAVVICSYEFARNKADDVRRTRWDLVVMDEAHRVRNVYRPTNVTANTLKAALAGSPKILLTATPLQNSLLELYGLISFIDEHAFGDLRSFREQFCGPKAERALDALRQRLKPLCHRTLRRQVQAYVPYTKRFAIVQRFTPGPSEHQLYERVSEYLRRPNLQALPAGQRALTTLVLRKLLASSTHAISGALLTMARRLRSGSDLDAAEALEADFGAFDSIAEEWGDEDSSLSPQEVRQAVGAEAAELEAFAELAASVVQNAKGEALLQALRVAFPKAQELGGAEKAIIFTESRRTQDYLLRLLADSSYADGVVLFNGSNSDPRSREIYHRWAERHAGSDRVTGSRTADMRSALVDYFRDEGRIMIATEAGAEGINLQFCSLVVNYDLPWNPQRIEQRIGRCHRYGQKHDVIVVNFLNERNEADIRVHELLAEKFKLFEGVFGASDEVLGAIESGVDLEKRIAAIYQQCRHPEDIRAAFDQLQSELSVEIDAAMRKTQVKLLENFDDEVREKLRATEREAKESLTRFEADLMRVTRHELDDAATWLSDGAFRLEAVPAWAPDAPAGPYELPRRSGEAHTHRLGAALADAVVERARRRALPPGEVTFDLSAHAGKVSVLDPLKGRSGWLAVELMTVSALGRTEDRLLATGVVDAGGDLTPQALERLWTVPSRAEGIAHPPLSILADLEARLDAHRSAVREEVGWRNAAYLEAEAEKLDRWADDLKVGLERELKEIDGHIREARRAASAAPTLDAKLEGQKSMRALEATRAQKRRALFDAQDDIDARRAELIAKIEGRLEQETTTERLFVVRWRLV